MNLLQKEIVQLAIDWVETHNEPIPISFIISNVTARAGTIRASTVTLCRKGYFRRSYQRGEVAYVLLRKR